MGTCRRHDPGTEIISSVPDLRADRATRPASVPSTVSQSRGQTFILSSGCREGTADGIKCRHGREVHRPRRTVPAC